MADVFWALVVGFLALVGGYTLLHRLALFLLQDCPMGRMLILLLPKEGDEPGEECIRRTLLRLEAHPLSPCDEVLVLTKEEEALPFSEKITPVTKEQLMELLDAAYFAADESIHGT